MFWGCFACEYILVGKSRLLSRKLGYSQAKLDTITQKSILAGKTLIRTRKLAVLSRKLTGSFRDNIRVSVIIYRVSVFVYICFCAIHRNFPLSPTWGGAWFMVTFYNSRGGSTLDCRPSNYSTM